MHEFDLIRTYFMRSKDNGDDAALLTPPPGHQIVTSIDTSVVNRHFRDTTKPHAIGYKSLAVSISDIAAMGAQPISCLLSLTIPGVPKIDTQWLHEFSAGFFECANIFNVALIGGDTTEGPLSVSTVVFGIVPTGQALLRSSAQVGDDIYVTGTLGSAAAALTDPDHDQTPLEYPEPRTSIYRIRDRITSCIDISDGLTQDLAHILKASAVGAVIEAHKIPYTTSLTHALYGGDDYELCFTAAPQQAKHIKKLDIPVTQIGTITRTKTLVLIDQDKQPHTITPKGYQHFRHHKDDADL